MPKGIYCIRNSITGERYIGSSVNLDARWLIHRTQLQRRCHHAAKLQAAWNRYGQGNLLFETVEEVTDRDNRTLCQREQYWIDHHDSYRKGYNSTPVASRPYTLTDEERGLRSELLRYGLYEPKYIQQIKLQNPLQYDLKEQEKWQEEFGQVCKSRSRYVLSGWLFFTILLVIYFFVAARYLPVMILLLPLTIWPIVLVGLRIGTAKRDDWQTLKANEPRAIAQRKQDDLVKVERNKRKSYRLPRIPRRMRYW